MRHCICTLLILFSVNCVFSQAQVNMFATFPAAMMQGQSQVIDIKIIKGDIINFAKYTLDVPEGVNVSEIDSKAGSFTFENKKLKIVWVEVPADKELNLKIKISIGGETPDKAVLNQKFYYMDGHHKKEIELEPVTISIEGVGGLAGSSKKYTHAAPTETVASKFDDPKDKQATPAKTETAPANKVADEKAEADRLAKEKIASDKAAKEQAAKDKAETDRLAKEKAVADKAAKDQAAKDKANADKLAREQTAKDKAEADRLAKEKAIADKAAKDQSAKEKMEADKLAKEQAAKDKAEADRLAKEKVAADKSAKEEAAKTNTVASNTGATTNNNNIAAPGLTYRIQLAASPDESVKNKFTTLGSLCNTVKEDGLYKVQCVANYNTKEEALKGLDELAAKGFKGFLAKYQDGKRIK